MQAGLLVQVRKVNNAHAVSQREDVTIVPLHPSWQTIKMISDLVRLLIRNFTLIDLTKIDCQMPTIREKKNNIVLEITKAPCPRPDCNESKKLCSTGDELGLVGTR